MRGIRRSIGTARAKKTPATVERILAVAPIASERLVDIRDRALLLFGFASAMRRSELAALDVEDIEETSDGQRVTIRHSKTDREGHGHVIAIPRGVIACPVMPEGGLKPPVARAGLPAGRQGRAHTGNEADRPQRCRHREGARQRAGLDPSYLLVIVALRLPDQRGCARRLDLQDGRSVAAQEHGHAAGLRPGRRDFQAPCRGRLAVRSLLPHLLRARSNRTRIPTAVALSKAHVAASAFPPLSRYH